jgi:hypothetical protein
VRSLRRKTFNDLLIEDVDDLDRWRDNVLAPRRLKLNAEKISVLAGHSVSRTSMV